MRTENLYPSTHDCVRAPMMGGQEDLVLGCLRNARARIQEHHTRNTYVGSGGEVCAIGAVLAADGFTPFTIAPSPGEPSEKILPALQGAVMLNQIESEMSQEAKEAIDLLNQAALDLHPEAAQPVEWSGPLEWVNQEWGEWIKDDDDEEEDEEARDEVVKQEILRIYDHAIAEREMAVA